MEPELFSTQKGSSESETPATTVGTLTKYPFGAPANSSAKLPSDSQLFSEAARDENTLQTGTELASHPLTERSADISLLFLADFNKEQQRPSLSSCLWETVLLVIMGTSLLGWW